MKKNDFFTDSSCFFAADLEADCSGIYAQHEQGQAHTKRS
jgi:hypothetical protein